MRFMMIFKANKDSESGAMPERKDLEEMMKFIEEMAKAGMLLAAEGLHPSSKGVRIEFSGNNQTVVKGPFPETNELVAGYWVIQAKSLDEAINWAKRAPMGGEATIEIRQIFEAADFGEEFTPELRKKEEQIREKVSSRK
jgi:hypothetical protein